MAYREEASSFREFFSARVREALQQPLGRLSVVNTDLGVFVATGSRGVNTGAFLATVVSSTPDGIGRLSSVSGQGRFMRPDATIWTSKEEGLVGADALGPLSGQDTLVLPYDWVDEGTLQGSGQYVVGEFFDIVRRAGPEADALSENGTRDEFAALVEAWGHPDPIVADYFGQSPS